MLRKSKEQFDSGGIIYNKNILIRFDEKLETEAEVDTFVEEQMIYLKSDLMVMLGYALENGTWIKVQNNKEPNRPKIEPEYIKNNKRSCNLLGRIFNRWTKWEVYQADQKCIRTRVHNATGLESPPEEVICDILKRTNKYTGMVKYKTVVKG
jgi:hypothetical protein